MNKKVVTFQVNLSGSPVNGWNEVPVVYSLIIDQNNLSHLTTVRTLARALAVAHKRTVRTAHLNVGEEVTIHNACNHNGGYYDPQQTDFEDLTT